MEPIEAQLRHFITNNFLFGQSNGNLKNEDSFLEQGIIDSTGILELVAFLEGEYHFTIEDEELVPDNLDSINNLVVFIGRKLRTVQA